MAVRALICMLLLAVAGSASAAGPNSAQEHGAEAFLAALAGGNVMAVAQELHPDELEKLRTRLLALLRAEGSRGGNTYRSRLFGPGTSLAQTREQRPREKFYAALSDRLRMRARVYEKFDWLAAVPDGKVVYLIGKGEQPKERGSVKVVVMVGLMQYGQQWRAIVPTEVEAQLDDLIEGRASAAPPPSAGAAGRSGRRARRNRWRRASASCWRAPRRPRRGQLPGVLRPVHEPELQPRHIAQSRARHWSRPAPTTRTRARP